MVGMVVGVAVVGLVIGVIVRMLAPRPKPAGVAVTAAAGLVGGVLAVVCVVAAGAPNTVGWVAGILVAAVFAGGACGLVMWRNGPWAPHDTAPRTITEPDERVRRQRRQRADRDAHR